MQLRYHGGGCCGVRHLIGFGDPVLDYRKYFFEGEAYKTTKYTDTQRNKMILDSVRGDPQQGMPILYNAPVADTHLQEFENIMEWSAANMVHKTIEVILNDNQVRSYPLWVEKLKEHGFELKLRFYNNNNSWCNVFHKSFAKTDDNTPKWWADKEEKAEAA